MISSHLKRQPPSLNLVRLALGEKELPQSAQVSVLESRGFLGVRPPLSSCPLLGGGVSGWCTVSQSLRDRPRAERFLFGEACAAAKAMGRVGSPRQRLQVCYGVQAGAGGFLSEHE